MDQRSIFLFVILGIIVLYFSFSIFKDLFKYFYYSIGNWYRRSQSLAENHRKILIKYSAYYKILDKQNQKLFEKRVQYFMYSKAFIYRSEGQVTDEMRVLISATAVQLAFGLDDIYLANFSKILIYPDTYYSNITKKHHKGEVNPRAGMIVLSWKNFVEGFADDTDNLNVGIHEMAHALHFENRIMNEENDFLNMQLLEQLNAITVRETLKIKTGQPHFLRAYAAANHYEFFAVALEHFFESPLAFKKAIPDLYGLLVRLLNQDPVRLYKLV